MSASVEPIQSHSHDEARAFLRAHDESSQFLINNLREHGEKLTAHPNSANFKLVRAPEGVVAVFALTRRGNLLAQSNDDFSELILDACRAEPLRLRGFIGDWKSIEPIWLRFQRENPDFKPTYQSKDILYSRSLAANDPFLRRDPRVRFLDERDYDQWALFSRDYLNELSLPEDLTSEERRHQFQTQIKEKIWWGLFDGTEMLSRAALNSKGETIGQVGGVFTPRQLRQKGYAKATMLHMLKDCLELHGHEKNVLFTGVEDVAAQKLYESIGYARFGHFALILS